VELINDVAGPVERLGGAEVIGVLRVLLLQVAYDLGDPLAGRPAADNFAVDVAAPEDKENVADLAFEVALETDPDLVGWHQEIIPSFQLVVPGELTPCSLLSEAAQRISEHPHLVKSWLLHDWLGSRLRRVLLLLRAATRGVDSFEARDGIRGAHHTV